MKLNISIVFICCYLLMTCNLFSDDAMKLNFNGYIDTYFVTDNDHLLQNPSNTISLPNVQRAFAYSDARKNEFDINIAQISGVFDYKDIAHGKITLQYGTLADVAYGGYPVQEAYAGFQLFKGLWIDAGYFFTHIGYESYLPKDNWLTSHSMVTYFEPFYHAGIKATYTNGAFTGGIHVLNGDNIFKDNNFNKTFGVYAAYQFCDQFSLCYASILGNEAAGSPNNSKFHTLHNLIVNSKLSDKIEFKVEGDYATRENVKSDSTNGTYFGVSGQCRYSFSDKFKTTVRVSYIDDKDGVYFTGITGLEAALGFEYKPIPTGYIRLEGGLLNFTKGDTGTGNIFHNATGTPTNSRISVMLNFGVWID